MVFAAMKVPVSVMYGTYDPLPGRLTFEGVRPYLPQLEYEEFERCGHYPWWEQVTADPFFALVHEWLPRRVDAGHNMTH